MHDPRADAGGELQVDERRSVAARRPRWTPPGRRGSRRCRARPASPSRSLMRSAACVPAQPGRIADEPTTPLRCTGPGRPMPTPSTRLAVRARVVEQQLHELGRAADRPVGLVVVRQLAPLLGEHLVGQVGEGDGQVALAEVDADREAGAPGRARSAPAGAHRRRAARPSASRSTTSPSACSAGHDASTRSSATGRCAGRRRRGSSRPSSRSAWMTRSRVDVAQGPGEPGSLLHGARSSPPGDGLSRARPKISVMLTLICSIAPKPFLDAGRGHVLVFGRNG